MKRIKCRKNIAKIGLIDLGEALIKKRPIGNYFLPNPPSKYLANWFFNNPEAIRGLCSVRGKYRNGSNHHPSWDGYNELALAICSAVVSG